MPIGEITDVVGAERYMREQLSDGTTLAHLVLDRIEFSRGKFRMAMPDTVDQTQSFDFRSGDLRMNGDEEMAFARAVKSFICDPDGAVLMQETFKISERFLRENGYENLVVSYKDELYWAVAGTESAGMSDEQMLFLLRSPSTNPFSAFFYLSAGPLPKILTDGDLDSILNGLLGVAVHALDFRSFLLWWRDELRRFPSSMLSSRCPVGSGGGNWRAAPKRSKS